MLVVVEVSVDVPVDGDEVVVLVSVDFVVDVSVDVDVPPLGEGFTIVVLFSVFDPGEAAGVTVSVRCSHAAKSAAPARMQIYFFIVLVECPKRVTA